MYLVGMINTIVYFVRLGNYNVPRVDGVDLVFHRERNVAAYIKVNFAIIVNMRLIRRVQRTVNNVLAVFCYRV